MNCHIMWHLIWIGTTCIFPTKRALCFNIWVKSVWLLCRNLPQKAAKAHGAVTPILLRPIFLYMRISSGLPDKGQITLCHFFRPPAIAARNFIK